ncbi:MAG: hypothetical protein KAS39_00245, partial [Actinomycetia bacterium]|nr:hypothetical protein [Actinomycetes bacterium]
MMAEKKGIKMETLLKIIIVLIILALGFLAYYYFFILPKRGAGIVETGEEELGPFKFKMAIYGPGPNQGTPGGLARPQYVAADKNGNIYITDEWHRFTVYNDAGRYLYYVGQRGVASPRPGRKSDWEPGDLYYPSGIDIAEDGKVYVADMKNTRIQVFDSTGDFLDWFPKEREEGDLFFPNDLYVKDGKIYVADGLNNQVRIYDTEGKLLKKFGELGRSPGEINAPGGIAVADDGTIYLTDKFNLTLTAFTPEGELKWVKGEAPKTDREPRLFGIPAGVDVTKKGNI